ncbi:MAG: NnrU family protein [Roseovarius sp.]|nr:NnrU family protein [Roseovarius sp.]
MGWPGFAAVFAAFFLTHSLPLRPRIRGAITARIGARGFGMAYSALSLGMLALLIWATGRAPFLMIWPQAPWQIHMVQAGMFAVCLIAAFGLGRPNPFSFGGMHNDRFDPARAGIVRHLRHPVLAALGLWGLVHLLPNGDLAHVILFSVLGGFAFLGMRLVDRRKRRQMGNAAWTRLREELAATPRLQPPLSWAGVAVRVALAALAYGVLVSLHGPVIGIRVM